MKCKIKLNRSSKKFKVIQKKKKKKSKEKKILSLKFFDLIKGKEERERKSNRLIPE